ncbi:MAG: Dps family protein [Pseudomonadota bacterium]
MSIAKIKESSNTEIQIGIDAKHREAVAKELKKILADTYSLQLKTQYYHWNVTGVNFHNLHLLFGTQYDELSLAVDELAERIRSLGFNAPGTFRQFLDISSIKEDAILPSNWPEMVSNLKDAHEEIAASIRNKIELAQKAGDEGTADLFIKRIQEHEKAAWFLRSQV